MVFFKQWLPLEKWIRRAKKTNQDITGFSVLTRWIASTSWLHAGMQPRCILVILVISDHSLIFRVIIPDAVFIQLSSWG
jgi:hypothetical protein